VAAEDALFGGPWTARIVVQHFHIVIRLQDKCVGRTNSLDHQLGGVSQIGEKTDITCLGSKEEANGIISVVRDAKRIH